MANYLERRGNYWYAFIAVPEDLRQSIGSAKRRKSLGTTDKKEAKLLAMQQVLEWKEEFDHLRRNAAEPYKIENIRDALEKYYKGLPEEEPFLVNGREVWVPVDREAEVTDYALINFIEDHELDRKSELEVIEAIDVATGKLVRLKDYIEGWRATSDATTKTLDVAEKDIKDMVSHFQYMEKITRPALKKYIRDQLGHLSLATQKRKASAWRVFWDYLMVELEIEEPRRPFDSLFDKAKTKASRKKINQIDRAAFSIEDVELLYNSAGGDHALKQLIKIGAYTGMRIEEICSKSRLSDGGTWLTVEEAKTEAGNRRVPIHQILIDDGTIDDWFNNIRPTLKPNKYGNHSDAIGKRFGRLKTRLGFGKDLVFHSLRHTVATQMKGKFPHYGIIINEVLGHEKPKDQSLGLYAKPTDDYKVELINSLCYNLD